MSFSTLFFVFIFLPVSLVLYYVVPARFRNAVLVVLSLLFFSWSKPVYLLLLLISLGFNYFSALEISAQKEQGKDSLAVFNFVVNIVINLLLLGFFKYLAFAISNLNALSGLKLNAPQVTPPIGITFYTLTILSYVIDVYRERTPVQKNPLDYMVFATFFPKMMMGPIVQYHDMADQIPTPKAYDRAVVAAGLKLFCIGLFKKVLIADNLTTIFSAISALPQMSAGTAWLGLLCYAFELYFDFSGYSDMAIGIAGMLGYRLAPNFNYPYRSVNITDLWRRWHISLGAWFRDYVYFPLGGSRCSTPRVLFNLLVIWVLTGLWHGASWTFIIWGLLNCGFSMLERFIIKDKMDRLPHGVRAFITCFIFFLTLVPFFSPSVPAFLHYYGQMFGADHMGLFDSTFLYYLRSSALLLVCAIIGSGPFVANLQKRLVYRRGRRAITVSTILFVLLLIASVASMLSATYTTFLYTQF